MEAFLTVLLKGCSKVIRFFFYQILVRFEVLGETVENGPNRRFGGDLVELDGNLDVQDFGVCALHIPGHMNFHKYEVVIMDLQNAMKASFK